MNSIFTIQTYLNLLFFQINSNHISENNFFTTIKST